MGAHKIKNLKNLAKEIRKARKNLAKEIRKARKNIQNVIPEDASLEKIYELFDKEITVFARLLRKKLYNKMKEKKLFEVTDDNEFIKTKKDLEKEFAIRENLCFIRISQWGFGIIISNMLKETQVSFRVQNPDFWRKIKENFSMLEIITLYNILLKFLD